MKKSLCLMLALVLLALSVPALGDGWGVSASNDDYSVYIGAGNRLYEPDGNEPLWDEAVRGVVCVVDGDVYFTAADPQTTEHDRDSVLYALDLADAEAEPAELARVAGGVVWRAADGAVYYVPQDGLAALWAYKPSTGESEKLADADGEIRGLRDSLLGLIVTTDAGDKLFATATRTFTAPDIDIAGTTVIAMGGTAELVLNAKGELAIIPSVGAEPTPIDGSVQCAAVRDGVAYYLKSAGDHSELCAYDPVKGESETYYVFSDPLLNELAVDGQFAYLIDEYAFIYRVDLKTREPELLAMLDREEVFSPVLLAFSNYLLVYDMADDSDASFVEAVDIDEALRKNEQIVAAADDAVDGPDEIAPAPVHEDEDIAFDEVDEDEPTAVPTPEPTSEPTPAAKRETEADFTNLTRGSRGEAVARLQRKLKELGYLSGAADGVYGAGTYGAVKLLQSDMGYTATGSAGPKFQYNLYYGRPPRYARYVPLQRGDSGERVVELQERLRALYYMVAGANGEYKASTVEAVKRFQREMGYKATGKISVSQLKKLYSKNAYAYGRYLSLSKGDSAPAVKRLCTRLKKLNYFSGKTTSTYGSGLVAAVKLFQGHYGIYPDGKADENLQLMIFDPDIDPYVPEPTPEPGPGPEQAITNKQLKTMRKWMNKHLNKDYSNKQAVKRLQNRLKDLGYYNGKLSKIYDEETLFAVAEFQLNVGLGASGYANADTLTSLFGLLK